MAFPSHDWAEHRASERVSQRFAGNPKVISG